MSIDVGENFQRVEKLRKREGDTLKLWDVVDKTGNNNHRDLPTNHQSWQRKHFISSQSMVAKKQLNHADIGQLREIL